MSWHSDEMIRQQELGYSESGNKHICADCIEDDALVEVLIENSSGEKCDFCGKKHETTGSFDAILERIANALSIDYSTPEDELPRDRETETGWAGKVMDIDEVLGNIGFETTEWNVMEDIYAAFGDRQFCDIDFGSMRPNERRLSGWSDFKYAIKHVRRFSFWSMDDDLNDPDHPDYLAIGKMLDEIGDIVRTANLSLQLKQETKFWPVRICKTENPLSNDHEFSPPPPQSTRQPNRMSPSGIPMFYGAESYTTACAETIDPKKTHGMTINAGVFTTKRPLNLLDLADLPELPSYFDLGQRNTRLAGIFLFRLAQDLATPIIRDGREHIDYVPTQAFTEYVRFQMKDADENGFDGIRYNSAKDGNPCVVLFCGQQECINDPEGYQIEQWLQLDPDSIQTEPAENMRIDLPDQ